VKKKSRLKRVKSHKLLVITLIAFIGLFLTAVGVRNLGSDKRFCANSISCIKNLSGKYEPDKAGIFEGRDVIAPVNLAQKYEENQVLGEAVLTDKHIYIDLTSQRLTAYEGSQLAFDFPVSTGKWHPTPTGEFKTWIKLRYTRMTGGNPAIGTYYNLPNVPHTMYFYNEQYPKTQGFGLHGAYWHNNFGHPMSHGCVNIGLDNAEKLYNWAPINTPVSISGTTPKD